MSLVREPEIGRQAREIDLALGEALKSTFDAQLASVASQRHPGRAPKRSAEVTRRDAGSQGELTESSLGMDFEELSDLVGQDPRPTGGRIRRPLGCPGEEAREEATGQACGPFDQFKGVCPLPVPRQQCPVANVNVSRDDTMMQQTLGGCGQKVEGLGRRDDHRTEVSSDGVCDLLDRTGVLEIGDHGVDDQVDAVHPTTEDAGSHQNDGRASDRLFRRPSAGTTPAGDLGNEEAIGSEDELTVSHLLTVPRLTSVIRHIRDNRIQDVCPCGDEEPTGDTSIVVFIDRTPARARRRIVPDELDRSSRAAREPSERPVQGLPLGRRESAQ
jgi:hypothetical protein